MTEPARGNFFEDFSLNLTSDHGVPRTLTDGDSALYTALTGSRFAIHCSAPLAEALGYRGVPLDDLLVFHVVFGQSVSDISLSAVANLGYADCRFGVPVYPGDTLSAASSVIGVKENSNRKTGVVYVRTTGFNQRHENVLEYVRWVMVRKRDPEAPAPKTVIPQLPDSVPAKELALPEGVQVTAENFNSWRSPPAWDDYEVGLRIDHQDGMTIEEAEHQMATRLYHNTARVHFNQHVEKDGRFGRRIVYGGHIISIARALSFNGLASGFRIAAINGGAHTAPSFAGDTIYAWSEVLEKHALPDRQDVGVLRLRTIATKDRACADFPRHVDDGKYDPAVVLDLDYSVFLPRRWWMPINQSGAQA